MKKYWNVNARLVTIGLVGWLIATNILVVTTHLTGWWLLTIPIFLCISFLPGAALLRLIQARFKTISAGIVYSFGLSILMLMVSGLATNQILHAFGVSRPLELPGILGLWDIVTAACIAMAAFKNTKSIRIKIFRLKDFSVLTWALIGSSMLLPCLAALGAFRLNNGGDALLAAATLCLAGVLIICSFLLRRRLPDGLLAWLIFIIGLTILLMTSLRGWDIVGHDIEREFRVYTLTHMNGHWDIALDRNPYNACLSITILPEMFAKLLNVPGLVVFKVVLQIVFAACPAVLYLLLRRYASKLGALVGSMLFICYPTFINDSAMLTRQGVAYLFFALALYLMSAKSLRKQDKILFLLCALGAVLSHYSTAYMFVALFAIGVFCKLCIMRWQRRKLKPSRRRLKPTLLSPLFAGLLLLMTFTWYTQITATSDGLVTTLNKSLANIPQLFSDDNKSSDTSTALFFAGGRSQADLYDSYLSTSSQLQNIPDTQDIIQYIPTLVGDDLPLTSLGEQAKSVGLDPSFITTLRQNFARFLQLLALAGVMYAVYALLRKKAYALGHDYIYLSIAGIVLLALMVVLPVLSINYGLLRAFQQALIFLILPITILLVRFFQKFNTRAKTATSITGVVFLFFLFTGMFAQILGGVSPSLSMNNRGLYYSLYYSPEADRQAFAWMQNNISEKSDVRAANFNRAAMHDPDYPFSESGILPSQIKEKTYTYLDPAQVQTKRLYTYYESSPLIMTFPINYYDKARNQIYSTMSTRVYR